MYIYHALTVQLNQGLNWKINIWIPVESCHNILLFFLVKKKKKKPEKKKTMAFSCWLSRLRSSSKSFFYSNLQTSHFHNLKTPKPHTTTPIFHSHTSKNPSLALLPAALAVSLSAGSLALQSQSNPSFCDASNLDSARWVSLIFEKKKKKFLDWLGKQGFSW